LPIQLYFQGCLHMPSPLLTPVTQLSLLIYLEIAPLPEQLNGNKGR